MNRFSLCYIPISVLAILGILSGCFFATTARSNRVIDQKYLLSIDSGSNGPAVWHGDELLITYTTSRHSGSLDMTGKIEVTGGIQYFTSFDEMSVEIFFTDDSGKVLDRRPLYNAGYRVSIDDWGMTFHRTVPVPTGATFMAFGYDGRAREGGGGGFGSNDNGGTAYSFWFSPLK
jgi:hypothetical protein